MSKGLGFGKSTMPRGSSSSSAAGAAKRSQSSSGSGTPGGMASQRGVASVLKNTEHLQQAPGSPGGRAGSEDKTKKLDGEAEDGKGSADMLAAQQLVEKAALAGLSEFFCFDDPLPIRILEDFLISSVPDGTDGPCRPRLSGPTQLQSRRGSAGIPVPAPPPLGDPLGPHTSSHGLLCR